MRLRYGGGELYYIFLSMKEQHLGQESNFIFVLTVLLLKFH